MTNTGTVLKATLGKLLRDGLERMIMAFSERMDTTLNWTELNWTELEAPPWFAHSTLDLQRPELVGAKGKSRRPPWCVKSPTAFLTLKLQQEIPSQAGVWREVRSASKPEPTTVKTRACWGWFKALWVCIHQRIALYNRYLLLLLLCSSQEAFLSAAHRMSPHAPAALSDASCQAG